MKRIALLAAAVVILCVSSGSARASWGSLTYSGYQPWWNIFAHRNKCLTPEEERLQKFWHDYYHAAEGLLRRPRPHRLGRVLQEPRLPDQLRRPRRLRSQRINYAPVFVSPSMQWAIPNSCIQGPPSGGGGYCPPYAGGPGIDRVRGATIRCLRGTGPGRPRRRPGPGLSPPARTSLPPPPAAASHFRPRPPPRRPAWGRLGPEGSRASPRT